MEGGGRVSVSAAEEGGTATVGRGGERLTFSTLQTMILPVDDVLLYMEPVILGF